MNTKKIFNLFLHVLSNILSMAYELLNKNHSKSLKMTKTKNFDKNLLARVPNTCPKNCKMD